MPSKTNDNIKSELDYQKAYAEKGMRKLQKGIKMGVPLTKDQSRKYNAYSRVIEGENKPMPKKKKKSSGGFLEGASNLARDVMGLGERAKKGYKKFKSMGE